MICKDYQQESLYEWEEKIIRPRFTVLIPYEKAQILIDGIWLQEGWLYPPKVKPLIGKLHEAKGSRSFIYLPRNKPSLLWVILHELAHTTTCEHDSGNGHDADFLGNYFFLLDKYLGISYPELIFTATQTGLRFNVLAKPWFLDK